MEIDKRTVQSEDIGLLAGVLLRTSNTAELFAQQVAQLTKAMEEKDKTIAELSAKCKQLIDEKNNGIQ